MKWCGGTFGMSSAATSITVVLVGTAAGRWASLPGKRRLPLPAGVSIAETGIEVAAHLAERPSKP